MILSKRYKLYSLNPFKYNAIGYVLCLENGNMKLKFKINLLHRVEISIVFFFVIIN